ncbi:MAG: hypothetical protein ACI8W7_000795 [Gammaproteobacteria bacterium]|jgi:hypothetical protein
MLSPQQLFVYDTTTTSCSSSILRADTIGNSRAEWPTTSHWLVNGAQGLAKHELPDGAAQGYIERP